MNQPEEKQKRQGWPVEQEKNKKPGQHEKGKVENFGVRIEVILFILWLALKA